MKTYQTAKPYIHPETAEFGILLYNFEDDDRAFVPLPVKRAATIGEACNREVGRHVRRAS